MMFDLAENLNFKDVEEKQKLEKQFTSDQNYFENEFKKKYNVSN